MTLRFLSYLSFAVAAILFSTSDSILESAATAGGADKPNIVFFLVDDMGWTDLACYGSTFYETPHIDALAEQGVRFTDAYAACHVCSPTRASIMTGKYPASLDLTDWLSGRREFPFQRLKNAVIHQALPLDEITLAESLRQHGYRTGHFGKWHLGEDPTGPLQQGFDVQIPRWNKGWPKQGYYSPFGFEGLEDEPGDYLTDRLTDEAIDFIEADEEKPFFLYLSHFAVHDPIHGRPDLVAKYERKLLMSPDENPFILEGNPDSGVLFPPAQLARMIEQDDYSEYRVLPNQMVKIKQRQDNVQFAAMVESVDESLSRVMSTLQSLELEQNTVIIFTSDNGGMAAANFGNPSRVVDPDRLDAAYSTSNLPLRGAKGWLYEGGIRVPLIIKWPGHGDAGSICREPVISTDFYPTILDIIGVASRPQQHCDGESLVPLLQGETTLDREAIFWHFPHYSNHGMQSPGGAVRCGRFKLLEYFENDTLQLFDLEADPGESRDLAETQPEIAQRLRGLLHKWREDVGANMMEPNPDYNPNATPSGVR
jgi:arylsulfatase A